MYPEVSSSNYNSAVTLSLSVNMYAACRFFAEGEHQACCPREKGAGIICNVRWQKTMLSCPSVL